MDLFPCMAECLMGNDVSSQLGHGRGGDAVIGWWDLFHEMTECRCGVCPNCPSHICCP